jgi:hypothetical protein
MPTKNTQIELEHGRGRATGVERSSPGGRAQRVAGGGAATAAGGFRGRVAPGVPAGLPRGPWGPWLGSAGPPAVLDAESERGEAGQVGTG